MPRLPRSPAQRQAILHRSMIIGAAGGRTALVAPEPRPLTPLAIAGGGGLPSDWSVTGDDKLSSSSHFELVSSDSAALSLWDEDESLEAVTFFATASGGSMFAHSGSGPTGYVQGGTIGVSTGGSALFEVSAFSGSDSIYAIMDGPHGTLELTTSTASGIVYDAHDGSSGGRVALYAGTTGVETQLIVERQDTGDYLTLVATSAHRYYMEIAESASAPSAPSSNYVRLYALDDGAGKTQLFAKFSSGAAQLLAVQP